VTVERRKPRIIVLGGGLGALSAVYWLTEAKPGWRDEYESIDVYQMGWRLGGKCASGRNPEIHQRIEEHGFHVWFGFYENAFRMMRGLYEALGRTPSPYKTFASVEEAFTRRSVWTFEQDIPGASRHWPVLFPVNGGVPGNGAADFEKALCQNLVGWLRNGRKIFIHRPDTVWPLALVAGVLRGIGLGATAAGAAVVRILQDVAATIAQVPHHPSRRRFVPYLLRTLIDTTWDDLSVEEDDEEAQRVRFMLDLVGTVVIGILQDRLWEPMWVPRNAFLRRLVRLAFRDDGRSYARNFESVDDEELRAWLTRHGAHRDTVDSPLLRQVYDIAFAFDDGNRDSPDLAAGTTARALLRMMFGYKGAFMWEMRAGMGDTILTPLYAVLRQRGVDFHFFHRVEAVRLDPKQPRVAAIDFDRQLDLRDGTYCPVTEVKGLHCWPSEPLWEQIVPERAEAFRAHVNAGGHMSDLESSVTEWRGRSETLDVLANDRVIMALPIGVLPRACEELLARSERWRDMVARVPSIPTYAVQLWLKEDTDTLGWKKGAPDAWPWLEKQDANERKRGRPSLGLEAVLCGYDEHLNAWADMSHVIAREDWPAGAAPRSVAYFAGTFVDGWKSSSPAPAPPGHYDAQLRQMRQRVQQVFEQRIGELWTAQPLGLDPRVLAAPAGAAGNQRYDAQYWRVNVDPAERYTLTPSRGTKYRLRPGESGFSNLVLAGDWTHNGVISMGCVEGTVVSGMEAAEAFTGPKLGVIAWREPLPVAERWSPGAMARARRTGDALADGLVSHARSPEERQTLWTQLQKREFVPHDAPQTQSPISRASIEPSIGLVQKLFNDHGVEIFLVLACYSLPSAYGAGKGARVLGRSRYLLLDPVRRLCETARFVMNVMMDPFGRGITSAHQVRMIHATLRMLMLQSQSEPWDTKKLGVPINQEDMLGTLMTFSWVVLDGLSKIGVPEARSPEVRQAVIDVWCAMGVELGIEPVLLPRTFDEAEALTFLIRARQIVPREINPIGRKLTQRLLATMERELRAWWAAPLFVSCLMRTFLPADVADGLGVPRRLGFDELTRAALDAGIMAGPVGFVVREWGHQLIDKVMWEHDRNEKLVDLPWKLVAEWWRPSSTPSRNVQRGGLQNAYVR
jgi:uncharacterized protein with NAD-binding domain and iron-sulfur cluster